MPRTRLDILSSLLVECRHFIAVAKHDAEVSQGTTLDHTIRIHASHLAEAQRWTEYHDALQNALCELELAQP